MEDFFFAVIPAKAGIQGLPELRDSRFGRYDSSLGHWRSP